MRLVVSRDEILANANVIDAYLADETVKDYATRLIKRGTCFIVMERDDGYRFYPSRFLGYLNNSMSKHEANEERDGRDTNRGIEQILGTGPTPMADMDEEYCAYCRKLGFEPNAKGSFGVKRKFWMWD